jgi:beta-galactosidase
MHVTAGLYPSNTTWKDVEWRVTNDAGIDTNIAAVEANGREAAVTALYDGRFRLRCMSKNGSAKTHVISQLEFESTGLGEACLNPYGFISGGLYNASNAAMTNGNDRGVATLGDGESQI